MSTSNYAVTVFGVSFFELLYLGIPTVVFSPYESKDQLELKEISKLGLALVAENEIEATELLLELMNDESLARRLSLRSRAILSNSGANRLCLELANLN
jgi:UDP-N-acetylglucosamine:LPS N-acetylglucosamine transferase